MKKIATILIGATMLTSCYEDYVKDFDYSGVYFTKLVNTRTVVVGEGLKIEFGAVLGGVMENKENRHVNFTLDNSLVNEGTFNSMKSGPNYIKQAIQGVTELKEMPEDYYTLSNSSSIIIPKGDHLGTITVRVDSMKFLEDPETLRAGYVLPFRIVSADADSIIPSMSTSVLGLRYENMLFGNYWHGGVTHVKDQSGNNVDTLYYDTTIPQADTKIYTLKTVAPHSLVTNKIGNGDLKGTLRITLRPDGKVDIEKADGASITVVDNGESRYNKAKLLQDRKLYLKYKVENEKGNIYHINDTLQFRNRIRDGVNEWQDENPNNYD